jgi:hypothetical protein
MPASPIEADQKVPGRVALLASMDSQRHEFAKGSYGF